MSSDTNAITKQHAIYKIYCNDYQHIVQRTFLQKKDTDMYHSPGIKYIFILHPLSL